MTRRSELLFSRFVIASAGNKCAEQRTPMKCVLELTISALLPY